MSQRKQFVFVLIIFSVYKIEQAIPTNNSLNIANGNDLIYLTKVLQDFPLVFKAVTIYKHFSKSLTEAKATSQCLTDMDSVLNGTKHGEIWAMKILDASTKIPSGFLEGNIADLGEFDECVNVGSSLTPSDIQAQHCLISANVFLNSTLDIGSGGTDDALGGALTLTLAWCLPKSCTLGEIQQVLQELTTLTNRFVPPGNNISLTVGSDDCHSKEYVPFNVLEWFALIFCLILACITALSTAYDLLRDNKVTTSSNIVSNKVKLLTSFSVVSNGKRLFNTSMTSESFPVLNCLKVLSIFWVIVGHRYRMIAENPLVNLLELPNGLKYLGNMVLLNAPLSVDVFFTISALLTTYGYLKIGYSRRPNIKSHLFNIVHRYLRLTPAFALMILFTVSLLYRLGDGPKWDAIVGKAKQDCLSYWWSGLLYINNYYNPDNSCMMQSWYLAADMQLYLFAPLVLYPLLKWPRWGLVLVAICVAFSVAIPFYVAFTEKIKAPIALSRNAERVRRETDALYLPTHTKTVSYVVGILLGYILFQIKVKKAVFKLNKVTNIIIWILAIFLLLASLFGCYPFFQLDTTYNQWTSSLYIGLYRLGWSLGIGWIILACSTGHGGFINSFVSWSVFAPLGRLTYCVYLVHVAVILVGLGSMRSPQYFDHYNILLSCFGVFAFSLFFAMILTLVMESPLLVIEKLLLHREPRRRTILRLTSGVSPAAADLSHRRMSGHSS